MSEQRLIKKYSNRRLYDTTASSYITLEDVKRLVQAGVDITVIDARSQKDLTKSTLLQVIYEQEDIMTGLLATETLRQMICFHDHKLQRAFSEFVEQSIRFFESQKEILENSGQQLTKELGISLPEDISERNLALWQAVQETCMQQEVAPDVSPLVKDDGI